LHIGVQVHSSAGRNNVCDLRGAVSTVVKPSHLAGQRQAKANSKRLLGVKNMVGVRAGEQHACFRDIVGGADLSGWAKHC